MRTLLAVISSAYSSTAAYSPYDIHYAQGIHAYESVIYLLFSLESAIFGQIHEQYL
jgi:hypothetical protein